MDPSLNQDDVMRRIEAQVNAQMGEVFREQVTDKCFSICADVDGRRRKEMSSWETDCIDKYVMVR